MNPGYTKKMPEIPDSINQVKVHRVYDELCYLVIGTKK